MADERKPTTLHDRADELYLEFLDERDGGGEPDFERLCKRHPELATTLRELHAQWKEAEALLDRLGSGRSLDSRLRRAFGQEVVPSVVLQDPPARDDGQVADVVERLTARGRLFGRYRWVSEVGRGGMGVVGHAWDDDLHRSVAMKVQGPAPKEKPGAPGSDAEVARFLEEAQLTAQLDHPGIPPVHEMGVDDQGRVYFTMKLVRGRSFDEALDDCSKGRGDWNLTRAIGVLQRVCDAVGHAHSKGVVHRDLKPSNIMLGSFGEVFVMDWGLARARPGRGEARSDAPPTRTRRGEVMGTPSYMSPEQAFGHHDQVGPASDVYAVGSMLYRLLAGRAPYSQPDGSSPGSRELLELVRQGPPPALSTVAPDALPELAAICERAMARDPKERYATILEVGEEMRAFLENRVVRAHRTGAIPELKMWTVRNRGLAAALVGLVAALALGLVGTLWQKRNAEVFAGEKVEEARLRKTAEDEAKDLALLANRRAEEARAAETEALRQKGRKEGILDFFVGVFDRATPERGGVDIPLTEAITIASEEMAQREDFDDLDRVFLHLHFAKIRESLGDDFEQVLWHAEEAHRLLSQAPRRYSRDVLEAELMMVNSWIWLGRFKEASAGLEQLRGGLLDELGASPVERLTVANDLALVRSSQGLHEESLGLFEEALDEAVDLFGPTFHLTLTIMDGYAVALEKSGETETAVDLLTECLTLRQDTLGPRHPDTLSSMNNRATALRRVGNLEEARDAFEETLEARTDVLGEEHTLVASTLANLGGVHMALGEGQEAEEYTRLAIEIYGKSLPPDAYDLLVTRVNLAQTFWRTGRPFEASKEMGEVLELGATKWPDQKDLGRRYSEYANMLLQANFLGKAHPPLMEAERILGRGGYGIEEAVKLMAGKLRHRGHTERAAPWLAAMNDLDASLPPLPEIDPGD